LRRIPRRLRGQVEAVVDDPVRAFPIRADQDVVDMDFGGGGEQHRAIEAGVVVEIKLVLLDAEIRGDGCCRRRI
jgi:hypothetical protein